MNTETVAEATSEIASSVAAVAEAARQEGAEVAEIVIAAAEQRAEAAEKAAQEITDAALMTRLGQEIATLRTENENWRNQVMMDVSSLRDQILTLAAQVSELLAKPSVAIITPQTEQSSLNQAPSAETPAEALQAAILPASVEAASPAPATDQPKAPMRRLI
jgi:hypothetical protein